MFLDFRNENNRYMYFTLYDTISEFRMSPFHQLSASSKECVNIHNTWTADTLSSSQIRLQQIYNKIKIFCQKILFSVF